MKLYLKPGGLLNRTARRGKREASAALLTKRQTFFYLLGVVWMFLSYWSVELYASRYLDPEGDAGLMFGFIWALLLTAIALALPRWIGKVVYGLSFYFFAIFAGVQCGYYAIFTRMMWIGDIRYAGEGGAFMGDVLGMFSTSWWCATAAVMIGGCIGCFLVPRGPRPARLRAACLLAAFSAAVGLFSYPVTQFRADGDTWGANNEYRRAMSQEGIYETMYDAHLLYQFCGIYQTTAKDVWEHNLYPHTFHYHRQVEGRAQELEALFAARPAHRENDMTGIFAGKNVVLVLMESIDDWLITEEDTPTLWRMKEEGIDFTNFYTPGYGSVRTFNTEFCVNTGSYLPTNGQYAFDYCTNDFSSSMPWQFRALGYSTQAFHYNDVTFYNRGVMEPAMGYEAYNSYMNFGMVGDALLSDTGVFENEVLMEKFFHGEEGQEYTGFFNFIISRNAHMTYTYDETLSRFALGQYPAYQGSSGHEEVDCLRAKARCCDDLFKYLLRTLEENGHLEDTVIIAFTDHYVYGMLDQERLRAESGVGEDTPLLVEKTPCIIWAADGPSMEVTKTCATADLLPTVLNLFGIDNGYIYLGRDIFDPDYPGYAVFADQSWINDQALCTGGHIDLVFDGQEPPTDEEKETMRYTAGKFVHMNNLILESDYYRRFNASREAEVTHPA